MRRTTPALLIALLPLAAAPALAGGLPVDETTYIERSLERDAPLTVEHPPVRRNPWGRRNGSSAEIAGGCREGGLVRLYDETGAVIVRQREICDSIAPRTLNPGEVDPRPVWPALPLAVVRARG
ncbi:hypothetical protein [uncultured Methylobacterium sp.]|jgi:hypothetical protein|uniref:hypothetical protein n=1 Tax=uncultured Methylobacterium sp. TaxID=157278 RepID=UPI00262AC977|nr:hypothetical protein [uncultured Methylobacterium sp.]